MRCRRSFALLLLAAACSAAVSFAQKPANAQVMVYGGYGVGVYSPVTTYYAPPAVYSTPIYTTYSAPVYYGGYPYGGYAAPAPVAYGGYYTAYPAVAPIGYAPIYPRNGLEVKYKFRHGLWYVDVDD